MTSPTIGEAVIEPIITSERGRLWSRELVLGLLPLLIGFQLIALMIYVPISLRGFADFRTLYAAAYMTRVHHGAEIYDNAKLLEFKERLAPLGMAFLQPMDHPAYENLIFLPLTCLPYRAAFLVFAAINIGLVVLCLRLLRPAFSSLSQRWKHFPIFLLAAFFPVTRAITQGQDSVILLLLLAGAFICLRNNRDLAAGLLTGAGLFKLQIVIPIALLFLIWRRWRFALGATASGIAALLLSWALVGTQGARQYVSILMSMSINLRTQADALRSSISPRTMLDLRGMISAIADRHLGHWWIQGLIVAASLAILAIAARCRPSLPLAITVAALVSYHLNVQDAIIMMIPIAFCLGSDSVWVALAAAAALVLPVAAVFPLYAFIGGVPFLALFIIYVWNEKRTVLGEDNTWAAKLA